MGGLSGGSRVRRPGSEDPHRREWKFYTFMWSQHLPLVEEAPFIELYLCGKGEASGLNKEDQVS